MKRYTYFLSITVLGMLLFACSGSEKGSENSTTTTPTTEKPVEETKDDENEGTDCKYSYVDDSTKVSFTAYKYESKAGVGGSFKECTVFPLNEKGECQEILEGMQFKIPTASSYTANEDRDKKIAEHFWGNLESNEFIEGEITATEGDASSGTAAITLSMNGQKQDVTGNYTMSDDGHVELKAEIDMTAFDGLDAIAALNKVCEDLHREAPGEESKLWPNVTVTVTGFFAKDCGE